MIIKKVTWGRYKLSCDWCGKEFERIKSWSCSDHHFCCLKHTILFARKYPEKYKGKNKNYKKTLEVEE